MTQLTRGTVLHSKNNVKTGLPLDLYFGFSILLVFSRLLIYCVFGSFSGDLGFQYMHFHPNPPPFLKFFC